MTEKEKQIVAKEILDEVYSAVEKARLESEYKNEKGEWVMDETEFMGEFTFGALHRLYAKYGIELFENSDKLE